MKKNRISQTADVEVKKTRDFGRITGWIWPYVIIPTIVAALLALFFFILGPLLLNWIGVKYSLEFWLITLALWGFATVLATLLWIYAKNHLLKPQYRVVSKYNVEKSYDYGKDQIESIEDENAKYIQQRKDFDEIDASYNDQRLIEQNYHHKDQSPSSSDSSEQKKSNIQSNNLDVNYLNEDNQTYVIQVDEPKTKSENQHLNPESDNCHPARRVSYAGVISVDIPLQEKKPDVEESTGKIHALRPPTPRFPRNMRVGSNDSYAELITLYPNYKQQKVSFSDNPESPTTTHSEPEKEVHLERVQIQQVSIVHGKVNGTASEDNGTQDLPVQTITLDNKNSIIPNSVSSKEEDGKKEILVVPKVRLSEEFDLGSENNHEKDRLQRMSLGRNQFLGWNPEEGVLAEADPGSKEREQMRWRRSLGAWHRSTSMPWNDENPREQENSDEEEVDDVFQENGTIIPKVHKIETQVTRTVIISQKAQKVNLEDDKK